MKAKTILLGLGALGALGAGGFATARGVRRMRARKQLERELAMFDEPVIITEEAVIISGPYEVEMEDVPAEGFSADQQQQQTSQEPPPMPGRGAGPR